MKNLIFILGYFTITHLSASGFLYKNGHFYPLRKDESCGNSLMEANNLPPSLLALQNTIRFEEEHPESSRVASIYDRINRLVQNGFFQNENPKILVIGPGLHFDEWLPFLLTMPTSTITLVDSKDFFFGGQRQSYFKHLASLILNQPWIERDAGSRVPVEILKTVFGVSNPDQETVINFLTEKISFLNPHSPQVNHAYDFGINRLANSYSVNFSLVRPGGIFWIVEDSYSEKIEHARNECGSKNVFSLPATHLSFLDGGTSRYQGLYLHRDLRAFVISLP
jgi:hypothetical protein